MTIPESFLVCYAISRLGLKVYTKQQPNSWARKFESACELQDTALLAKLAAGDMIEIESKYHNLCLCALFNRARLAPPMDNDGVEACIHGIAFAQLVVFLENASSDENSLLSSDSGTLLNCIMTDWSILESL